MSFTFGKTDIKKISETLGTKARQVGNSIRFEVHGRENKRRLALELYSAISIGKRKGSLVSVYAPTAHLQLHFCTGFVASNLLGEVTFVGESNGKLCGLTVEREGGCSLYANVDREMLSGDFTALGPEVMLSGIAMSLTESTLPSKTMSEEEFTLRVLKGRKKRSYGGRRTKRE